MLRFYWQATKATFGVLWVTNATSGTEAALRHPTTLPARSLAWRVLVLSTGKSLAYALAWPTMAISLLVDRTNPFFLRARHLESGRFFMDDYPEKAVSIAGDDGGAHPHA